MEAVDLNWLFVLTATVLPMLTGLVTARVANAGVKAIVLAGLSAIGGLLVELQSASGVPGAVDWSASGANAFTLFLSAVGLHFGLLKSAGVTGADGVIQRSAPQGIGGNEGLK